MAKQKWLKTGAAIVAGALGVGLAYSFTDVATTTNQAAADNTAADDTPASPPIPSPGSPPATTSATPGLVAPSLEPGKEPPQFVVFSWDGGATPDLQERFRRVMATYDGHMTIFLTGIYFVPNQLRNVYEPPGKPRGASDIAFARHDASARGIIGAISASYNAGHEIGTHYNGHFCGRGGVGTWTPEQWTSEINQAKKFVMDFKNITGFHDMPDLPFNYEDELKGSRTPCLEGQKNLLVAAERLGWDYDSSGVGTIIWPRKFKDHDLWDIPMQMMPWKNGGQVLSMDYNYMVTQSGPSGTKDASQWPRFRQEMRDSLVAGLDKAMTTNRAPVIIGNHFNDWNGGVYMDAVEDVMHEAGKREGVKLVSFKELVAWLEAQDPELLAKVQALQVGQAPPGGWETYLRPGPMPAPEATGVLGPDNILVPGPPPTPRDPAAPRNARQS